MSRLLTLCAWIALVAGLAMPTLFPEVANVTVLVMMGVGALALLLQRDTTVFRQPGIVTLLAAGALLLVTLLPTARSAEHILALFVLAPLWFAGCYAGLVERLAEKVTPALIGTLALLGAVGAAGISGYEVLVLGAQRGGFLVNNPIHLADLAVALGFVALVGLYDRAPWRWLLLIGPLAGLAAVIWSGSRGPLLGFAAIAIVGGTYLVFTLWRGHRAVRWGFVGLVVLGLAASPFVHLPLGGRVFSLGGTLAQIVSPNPDDASSQERSYMYQSAWGALQASPLYGHGMIDYTSIAAQYGPVDNPFPPSGHLHSDIADFAVIGGALGLLSYLIILLAPTIGGLAAGAARRPALYLGLVMSSGYLVMGLTNAMIGILTQTVLFGVVTALIAVLGRRKAA